MQFLAPPSEILLLLLNFIGNLMAGNENIDDLMDVFFDRIILKLLDVAAGNYMLLFSGFALEPGGEQFNDVFDLLLGK